MPRILIAALCSCLTLTAAHAQPMNGNNAVEAAHARFQTLLEISEPVRATFSDAITGAGTVMQSDAAQRTARAEEFSVSAESARAAMTMALQRLNALDTFPDTPSEPELAVLVRNHQEGAVRGIHSGLELLARLERVVSAYVNQDAQVIADEGNALVVASVLLTRDAASQAPLRARLTPEVPWVEPMDNASAELIDGMASLIELRVANAEQQQTIRASIHHHADRLQQYVDAANETIGTASDDAELSLVIAELRPQLDQRLAWFNQAARELEAAANSSDTSEQRQRLMTVRALYRQVTESQQSMFR